MFTDYPSYPLYRTLALTDPLQRGEDVYALQLALLEIGTNPGTPDGVFGAQTDRAVRAAQTHLNLIVDGKAGGLTQRALALQIATGVAAKLTVPFSGIKGQLEHESGYRLGIYSPLRADGTYDAGVAQRNTKYTDPKLGFNPKDAIGALALNTWKYFSMFEGLPMFRRWALAQGAWNAPAFACYIAREEGAKQVPVGQTLRPGTAARATFEEYVRDVTIYLTV